MAFCEGTDIAHKENQEYWDRMRQALNIPCLISGLFCADKKVMQGMTISKDPGSDDEAPKALIRHVTARMSALAAIQAAPDGQDDAARRGNGPVQYPLWLRMRNAAVGVGRPLASLYPVVAYQEPGVAAGSSVQDMLGLGLFQAEYALTRNVTARPAWIEGLAEATLRLLSIGLFVVDGRGNILHDQSGDDRTREALWVRAGSRLAVRSENERLALQAAITAATSEGRVGSITSVTSGTGRMQMVAVAPMQQGDRALALILFELQQTDHRALREHFFRVHELTKSEGLIAREVLDGRAPAEIAQRTGMSVGTVRGYLKQVFAKTGTHRQSELVSHYYASILPIGANIARADMRVGPVRQRSEPAVPVHDGRLN